MIQTFRRTSLLFALFAACVILNVSVVQGGLIDDVSKLVYLHDPALMEAPITNTDIVCFSREVL